MGKKVWSEEVDNVIGMDKDGNPITVKKEVEYYQITCDYCGKVIEDSKKGIVGQSYIIDVDGKYYHTNCYEIVKVSGSE